MQTCAYCLILIMGYLADGWTKREKITFDGSVLSGAVSDAIWKVLPSAGMRTELQAAWEDLRFSSADQGNTALSYGVEKVGASGAAHVLVPTTAAGNTDIYCWGGNAGAADAQAKTTVVAAYELYLPLGDTASPAVDWTSNGYNATQNGGVTFGATGQVDGACDFDNSNDYLDNGTLVAITQDITMIQWVNLDGFGVADDNRMWTFGTASAMSVLTNAQKVRFARYDGVGWVADKTYGDSAATLSADTWYHIACVYEHSSGDHRIYVDGVLSKTFTDIHVWSPSSNGYEIGRLHSGSEWLDGTVDQGGVASTVFSTDQILADRWLYPASAKYTFSGVETVGALVLREYPRGISRGAARGIA